MTAQFGMSKSKFRTKTIDIVREVEESKEVSKFESIPNSAEKKCPSLTKLTNKLDKSLSKDYDSRSESKSRSLSIESSIRMDIRFGSL